MPPDIQRNLLGKDFLPSASAVLHQHTAGIASNVGELRKALTELQSQLHELQCFERKLDELTKFVRKPHHQYAQDVEKEGVPEPVHSSLVEELKSTAREFNLIIQNLNNMANSMQVQ